jgi:G3E family GTPase
LDNPISNSTFDNWLDTLIEAKGSDILRIKGIVFLEDIDAPFVFHGVQHVFDPPVQLKEWPKKDRQSRIVVIARNISQLQLQRSLNMLRIQSDN